MANPEHLEILEQGVDAWNLWREDNPEISPDLREANLLRGDLRWVNFGDADLGCAYLVDANLDTAKLTGARLTGAVLAGADLSRAILNGADLTQANLIGATLIAAHLGKALLTKAKLDNANLTQAHLYGADLKGASLQRANLTNALLADADLSDASLENADLTVAFLRDTNFARASLVRAILRDSELSGADLRAATMSGTVLGSVDLSAASGLETVEHYGPSQLSVDTLFRSGGKIHETFLRGCGVPEAFIVQIPALVSAVEPIQFYSCFISYSSKDQEFAYRLYADLQAQSVRCWFAPEDLKIGDRFRTRIDEVIRIYDKLLLILSKNSVGSQWVEKEVETALERERAQGRTMLFPVRLDDAVSEVETGWPADIRRTRHIGDFSSWREYGPYKNAINRLLRDLRAEGKPASPIDAENIPF